MAKMAQKWIDTEHRYIPYELPEGASCYEDDWLKTKDGYYCYVVWFDGFWWVKSLPSEAMDLEHSEFYKECEIIGNIHENADLIQIKGVKTR